MNTSSNKYLLAANIIGLLLSIKGLIDGLAETNHNLLGPVAVFCAFAASVVLMRFKEYDVSLGVSAFISVLWMFSVVQPQEAMALYAGVGLGSRTLNIDLTSVVVLVPLSLALYRHYRSGGNEDPEEM